MNIAARDLRIDPIHKKDAEACIRAWHYSGKPYVKSRLHAGVFAQGRLLGAIQFGPSIDTRNSIGLVPGTSWDGYLEINRMALSDELPKNSESLALGVCFRMIRRYATHIAWIVSYSDATQCGDGAVYRASGMDLTAIRKNTTLWQTPKGRIVSDVGMRTSRKLRDEYGITSRSPSAADLRAAGMERLAGHQIRYMKFFSDESRARFTGPILPYSDIGASVSMVRGTRTHALPIVDGGEGPPPPDVRPDRGAPQIQHYIAGMTASWRDACACLPNRSGPIASKVPGLS